MSDLHLHLLLGGAVAMANDGDDTTQLHPAVGSEKTEHAVWVGPVGGASTGRNGRAATHMLPEVVGTMGMSSASMGMDQGMWK